MQDALTGPRVARAALAARGRQRIRSRGRLRRPCCKNDAVHVVLIVADDHPVDGTTLREVAESALASRGHAVDVIDLGGGDFDPAMSTAGRRAYHSGHPLVEPDVADFGPRVSAAEALVFVYRAGWTGLSPRMKGFMDRTFVPGVGFHLVDGKLQRALTGVRRVVAVALHERSRREVRRSRDGGRTVRLIVHPRCKQRYVPLYVTAPERAAAARRRFDKRFARALGEL